MDDEMEDEVIDVNYLELKDRSGRTALNYAVYNGHMKCAMALIDAGCSIESKTSKSLVRFLIKNHL